MAMACCTGAAAEMHHTGIHLCSTDTTTPTQAVATWATTHCNTLQQACSVMPCTSPSCQQQSHTWSASCFALPGSLHVLSQHRTQYSTQNWVTCATGPLNAACNMHGNKLAPAKQRQNDSKYVWAGYGAGVDLINTPSMPEAQLTLHTAHTQLHAATSCGLARALQRMDGARFTSGSVRTCSPRRSGSLTHRRTWWGSL
jgi:hypothetical protein